MQIWKHCTYILLKKIERIDKQHDKTLRSILNMEERFVKERRLINHNELASYKKKIDLILSYNTVKNIMHDIWMAFSMI